MARLKRRKKILFAMITVVLFFSLMEISTWIAPTEDSDRRAPFVFSIKPQGELLEYRDEEKKGKFIEIKDWEIFGQWVTQEKPKDEIRVVFFGGSALVGQDVPFPATFPFICQRLLNEADPEHRYKIINMGRSGNASPQMAYFAEQTLDALKPDLVVTVMGNNEYLDLLPFLEEPEAKLDQWLFARFIERNIAFSRWFAPEIKKEEAPAEKRPLSDLKAELPDEQSLARVNGKLRKYAMGRLKRSLSDIEAAAKKAGARMLVCTVPTNYRYSSSCKDWFFTPQDEKAQRQYARARWALYYQAPKIAQEIMEQRTAEHPEEAAAWLILGRAAKAAGEAELSDSAYKNCIRLARKATTRDDDFRPRTIFALAKKESEGEGAGRDEILEFIDSVAGTRKSNEQLWKLGTLYSILGEVDQARSLFERSLSYELHSFRADSRTIEVLTDFSKLNPGVHSLDLRAKINALCPQGISGFEYIFDYCHYNPRGHIVVGHLLAKRIAELFDIEKAIPDFHAALADEMKRRKSRETDLPEIEIWAGADFDVPLLIAEFRPPVDVMEKLKIRMQQLGETPLALTFLGNWNWRYSGPCANQTTLDCYRRALELDPDFTPAQHNIDLIEKADCY